MRRAAEVSIILILALLFVGFGPSKHRQGRKHLEREEYAQALAVLTDALNEDPENPKIHRDLGIAYYKSEQYEQALEELNKAKEDLDKDGQVMFHLGLAYERLGQYDKAIEEYSNYVKLGRFSSIKKELEQRVQWLIQQQASQWAKDRMKIEEQLDVASIPDNTVGVTYFKPFSVPEELKSLHIGLTDLIIIDLSMVESLTVVERIKLRELYNEMGLASTDVIAENTAPKMGKLLGANSLVTGTFTGFGDKQWRIDPALGSVKKGELLSLEALQGEIPDFLQTEKDLVLEILRNLGIEVTPEEEEKIRQNIPTESLEAFLAYCRGLDYMDKGMYEEAQKEFENAISIDSGFDQARAHLETSSLLSKPVQDISGLESSWNSAIIAERGRDALLRTTVHGIAQGDIGRTPVSDVKPGRGEVELEVEIRW